MANMTLAEWNALCNERGMDPLTGGKAGVQFVHFVNTDKIRAEFDEWADKMRAQERAGKPQPKKRWRLRWVQE